MFKNLHEMITSMNDEQACIEYLAAQRWPDGKAVCPYCGYGKCYRIENGKRYKCASKECYKRFHVTVGTIFHASNIPLVKWFMAVYVATAHKKGISSYQLAKDIGVTQKTGWYMLHRIRHGMKNKGKNMFSGIVESDETYMAKKYRSDYKGLPPEQIEYIRNNKHNTSNKGAVLGIADRLSKTIHVAAFSENNSTNIRSEIKKKVEAGSVLMTDESFLYRAGLEEYTKKSVYHSKEEWTRVEGNFNIHTNLVENFWSVMKRGVYGTYHQISFKHLQAYCNEFSHRYNSRKLKDAERFTLTLKQVEGKLPYKTLVYYGKTDEEIKQIKAQKASFQIPRKN